MKRNETTGIRMQTASILKRKKFPLAEREMKVDPTVYCMYLLNAGNLEWVIAQDACIIWYENLMMGVDFHRDGSTFRGKHSTRNYLTWSGDSLMYLELSP